MNSSDISQVASLTRQARTILVVLPSKPSFDHQLAASSLFLSLKQDKQISLLGVSKINNPTIVGLDQLKTEVGRNNLLISLDYTPESVDNVGYHLDEKLNKFYLTIKPKKGFPPLNKSSVQMELVGAEADLIFLFGVSELEDLEQLYLGYETLYSSSSLVTIGSAQPNYQGYFLDSALASSGCEIVHLILRELNTNLDTEAATNLLAGIQYETNNFIDPVASATTFECVADLLRSGARRKTGAFSNLASGKDLAREPLGKGVKTESQNASSAAGNRQDTELFSAQYVGVETKEVLDGESDQAKTVKAVASPAQTATSSSHSITSASDNQVIRPSGLRK